MRLPSTSMVLILKSMPMVVMNVGLKLSLAYRSSRQVLPTPAEVTGGGGGGWGARVSSSSRARPAHANPTRCLTAHPEPAGGKRQQPGRRAAAAGSAAGRRTANAARAAARAANSQLDIQGAAAATAHKRHVQSAPMPADGRGVAQRVPAERLRGHPDKRHRRDVRRDGDVARRAAGEHEPARVQRGRARRAAAGRGAGAQERRDGRVGLHGHGDAGVLGCGRQPRRRAHLVVVRPCGGAREGGEAQEAVRAHRVPCPRARKTGEVTAPRL